MRTVIAFAVGVCFGIASLAIAQCNPPRPTDCGCKDCETEKKCQIKCLCAKPLR